MNNDTTTTTETTTPTPEAWAAHLARVLLTLGTAMCVLFTISPAEGLLAGACIALLFGNPQAKLTHKWSGLILQIAVVLMGAGMNLSVVWRVGASGVLYTIVGITLTMLAGLWLGRRFKVEGDVALLVSAGTAICGGSAIAAMSAATKPKAHDMAVSLGSIFLLTALGMIVFPQVGQVLGFSQEQFGMWSALALHDTSSVVGAATAYGATALGVAVTVKLTRALWIVPLTAVMSLWHARKAARVAHSLAGGETTVLAPTAPDKSAQGRVRETLGNDAEDTGALNGRDNASNPPVVCGAPSGRDFSHDEFPGSRRLDPGLTSGAPLARKPASMSTGGRGALPAKAAWRRFMPQAFIIWYLVMAAVFTYAPVWAPGLEGMFKQATPWFGLAARRLLTLALFLIGAGLSREALRRTGVQPLKMAGALWVFVSVVTALALWAGWIVAPQV